MSANYNQIDYTYEEFDKALAEANLTQKIFQSIIQKLMMRSMYMTVGLLNIYDANDNYPTQYCSYELYLKCQDKNSGEKLSKQPIRLLIESKKYNTRGANDEPAEKYRTDKKHRPYDVMKSILLRTLIEVELLVDEGFNTIDAAEGKKEYQFINILRGIKNTNYAELDALDLTDDLTRKLETSIQCYHTLRPVNINNGKAIANNIVAMYHKLIKQIILTSMIIMRPNGERRLTQAHILSSLIILGFPPAIYKIILEDIDYFIAKAAQ